MNFLKSLFSASSNDDILSVTEAQTRLEQDKTLFILDVRQPDEFRAGHINGSKLIPLHELGRRINELPKDRDILCVCRSGGRSGAAQRQLQSAGYRALNLRGGLISWQQAGLPVRRGK